MMPSKLNIALILFGLFVIVMSQAIFIVDEREQAIVLQLGQPVGELRNPGLHFKIPVVQDVRRFDRRILSVDPPPEQVVISSADIQGPRVRPLQTEETEAENSEAAEEAEAEGGPVIENVSGEPIIVDSFARYKIIDPLQFLKTLIAVENANIRLQNILRDATRAVLGKTTLRELLSTEREDVMNDIRSRMNRIIQQDQLGIEIVDVRIVRADLTAELRDSTVRRMISELQERATETRAKGEEQAKEIRSQAEKERTILLANAQRDSQVLRGQGDEEAIRIYAEAFNKDKEFYGFIRSMEAYRNTLADPDTRLILSPDSEFFKHFESGGR